MTGCRLFIAGLLPGKAMRTSNHRGPAREGAASRPWLKRRDLGQKPQNDPERQGLRAPRRPVKNEAIEPEPRREMSDSRERLIAAAAEVLIGIMQGAHVMAKACNDSSFFANYGQLAVEMIRAAGNPK